MAAPVKLARTIAFKSAPAAVRAALDDVPGVVGCIPGATVTATNPDGSHAATIGVHYADAGVRFAGTVRAASDGDSMVVSASGKDGPGTVSATGAIRLVMRADGAGTSMDVQAEFEFGGLLAPIARSATKIVGPHLLEAFGSCLVSKVDG
ncbi:MAG: hypothetical protein FJ034_00210 [Chloroflexi bacterium]|nr:hypothetical protein [Chloroflexota bacterium]